MLFTVDATFANRTALRDALAETGAGEMLTLEGEYELTVGAPVTVRVHVVGLASGVFLETVVQTRRSADARGAEHPALGLRLLPGQQGRFEFLRTYADGQHAGSGRVEWRYPYDRRCVLASHGKGTGRMLHGAMRDVSPNGALISAPALAVTSRELSLEFELEGAARRLASRVAWSGRDRVGLRLLLERPEERTVWQRVYGAAMQQFEGALSTPSGGRGADETARRRLRRP